MYILHIYIIPIYKYRSLMISPSFLPSRTCHVQHCQVQGREAPLGFLHRLGAAVHGQDAALVAARQQGAGDAWWDGHLKNGDFPGKNGDFP